MTASRTYPNIREIKVAPPTVKVAFKGGLVTSYQVDLSAKTLNYHPLNSTPSVTLWRYILRSSLRLTFKGGDRIVRDPIS